MPQPAVGVAEDLNLVSPASLTSLDEYSNRRFIELQEELRSVLFAGISNDETGPDDALASPESTDRTDQPQSWPQQPQYKPKKGSCLAGLTVSVPESRIVHYLKNWIVECAPHLDKFDNACHFGIHVPLMAETSPSLLHAMLAFSARQIERKARLEKSYDSLELYQQSIRLLAPSLQARDPNVLVTACLLAVLELMSDSPRNWRRHIEGCATLFAFFEVTGFSGGMLQAVFWCYARMELCGAIISAGAQSTVLTLDKWIPRVPADVVTNDGIDEFSRRIFYQSGRETPEMHANWAVYLCAKACDLIFRRTRYEELGEHDYQDSRTFEQQWLRLWEDLQYWLATRPESMLPASFVQSAEGVFPSIFFPFYPAISSNQLYHAACMLLLDISPGVQDTSSSLHSPLWHARRICGISFSNPHRPSLINAIQPLYLAGRILTHYSEHVEVARLLKLITTTTGWGALWRIRDLEVEWGYQSGEIFAAT